MKTVMGAVFFVLLCGCSNLHAAQRFIINYHDKDTTVKWKEDGDIHIFDFKFNNRKYPKKIKMNLLKTDSIHDGIWIKGYEGNLPEGISVRYFHISDDGSRMYGKDMPTIAGKPADGTAEKAISDAKAAYDVFNYKESLAIFIAVYTQWPTHRVAPYSMFMAGQCLCAMGEYEKSMAVHKALVAKYPYSSTASEAAYRIACVTAGHLGMPDEGVRLFAAIVKKYPTTKACSDSLFNIAAIHIIQNKTKQAIAEFTLLLKNYPHCFRTYATKNILKELAQAVN